MEALSARAERAEADPLTDEFKGMTLRDYFAGQALVTMRISHWTDNPLYWEGVARSAYVCADAMLEARKAGER